MQKMSGKQARVDKLRAAVEWEQSMKEIENAILRKTGASLSADDLAQLVASIEWVDSSNFSGHLSTADDTVKEAFETLDQSGRLLLDEASASNAAHVTLNSANAGDYDELEVELIDFYPATGSDLLHLWFTDVDGNLLYGGADHFIHLGNGYDAGGAEVRWASSAGTGYAVLTSAMSASNSHRGQGRLYLSGVASTVYSRFRGEIQWQGALDHTVAQVAGRYSGPGSPEALGGVRLAMSSGNINGTFRLWGLPKGN